MNNENEILLLIDEEYSPIIIESECATLKPIIKKFIECFVENKDKPVEGWLSKIMQENLQEKSPKEIKSITDEIISTIKRNEENKKSLMEAISNGRSKEDWFASKTIESTSAMSKQETVKYLGNLDTAIQDANESLYGTITTQAGVVSQNPRLDGFIAEQHHAQTFNLNAVANGSQYRAKVLEPTGEGYVKNSVDIVIVDGNGKVAKRYQSKYCKDANATARAFEHGDYRGQQKLVPEGQQDSIKKKCTTIIESPDGITSDPLSKPKAEQMRDEAQSGQWKERNWNEYKTKDLAIGIGKEAGYAALQGAAIGIGFDVAQKLCKGEDIKGEEVVETAIRSGFDFGVKAAASGAIKVGVEKGIVTAIPKGTPASTITNIVFIAIENVKILGKVCTGELSFKEGIEKIEQTTVATTAGLAMMGEGALIGKVCGAVFGPVGAAVGGFVGGTVGYMAGSKIGETVVKGARKLHDCAVKAVKNIINDISSDIKSTYSNIKTGVSKLCRRVITSIGF